METTDKNYYCCECIHYMFGLLENPCAKSKPYVGYLNRGCSEWKDKDGNRIPKVTHKVCETCGKLLPLEAFRRNKDTKDRLSKSCKECKPYKPKKQKSCELDS